MPETPAGIKEHGHDQNTIAPNERRLATVVPGWVRRTSCLLALATIVLLTVYAQYWKPALWGVFRPDWKPLPKEVPKLAIILVSGNPWLWQIGAAAIGMALVIKDGWLSQRQGDIVNWVGLWLLIATCTGIVWLFVGPLLELRRA